MIPSVILEGRLMLSGETDYYEDYFENELDNGNETPDDTGMVLGCQALLVL